MKRLWPIAGLILLVAVLTREFFPKRIHGTPPAPLIITAHDTAHDTLKVDVPSKPDTVNLTIRVTIHDTTYVNVSPVPVERTNIWPVLSLSVGKTVGDTTRVNTFSLRTGQGATSLFYTTGPLRNVWADSLGSPRLDFGPPPDPYAVRFLDKLKWGGIGYGSCTVVNALANLLRR